MKRLRVGVLISGRGSNMAALVQAAQQPHYPAVITAVIANKASAEGLIFAQNMNIPTHVIENKDFSSRDAYDAALRDLLVSLEVDVVACAGFMRILTPVMVESFSGRLINIHPSLLPLYKGLHTHERALADGAKRHGCTVHYVSAELDAGPIIAQAEVPVLVDDSVESLSARVLVAEHRLYPEALAKICAELIEKRQKN